ncbi:MAG TPA: hypothetical protein VFB21_07060 [Chthonomonadaceae bacterium]|nr:hypothetical protein [Chthonomonadaceae bacterium]
MRRHNFLLLVQASAIVLALIPSLTAYGGQNGFNLAKLRPIVDDHSIPPAERIARGVAYLKEELASPSPESWGLAGGPIDTGYIQEVIVGVLAFPGVEAPKALRQQRDNATDKRMKDRLTISLGLAGAQDTIPDILRIARTDPEGAVRTTALRALTELATPPSPTEVPLRYLPGQVYHPLNAKAVQAMTEGFLSSLQDTYKRYTGVNKEQATPYYPAQFYSKLGLRLLGYQVETTKQGWRIFNSKGQLVREVALKQAE